MSWKAYIDSIIAIEDARIVAQMDELVKQSEREGKVMSTVTEPVATGFKGRAGYHPCDRDTFLKLKVLHKAFWENVRKQAAQERWDAKTIYRQGPRPEICEIFRTTRYYVPVELEPDLKGNRMRRHTEGHAIRKVYLLAKNAQPEPCKEFTAEELSQIDKWIEQLTLWQQS